MSNLTREQIKRSKALSLVLRHKPETIGITLDDKGWADVKELMQKWPSKFKQLQLTLAKLQETVEICPKQRFAFDESGNKIRCVQGHSVKVNPDLEAVQPPNQLFHGTATRFLDSIMKEGLVPKSRTLVHLSKDLEPATTVGSRHGKVAILIVDSAKMHSLGYEFYLAENGVWLTERVPVEFIKENS